MDKPRFMVARDTEHASDEFAPYSDTLECAKSCAMDVLMEWMDFFDPTIEPSPAEDAWNYMIDNCSVRVMELDPETGEYEDEWEPSDDDFRNVGWLHWEDMPEDMRNAHARSWKEALDTASDEGEAT